MTFSKFADCSDFSVVDATEARYVWGGQSLDNVGLCSEHTLESIRERFRSGARLKFLCFWGHEASREQVGKECLSQWYPAAFSIEGLRFRTAEHFMMYRKAKLFDDEKAAADILSAAQSKRLVEQFAASTKACGRLTGAASWLKETSPSSRNPIHCESF